MKSRPILLLLFNRLVHALPYFSQGSTIQKLGKHTHGVEPGSPEFWWKIITSSILVLLGGVFAG